MSDHNDIVTSDLARFGFREIKMAAILLAAYCENPPEFLGDGLIVMLNLHSGYVFLTDDEFTVAMMNSDRLEQFYFCPECGAEGFEREQGDRNF